MRKTIKCMINSFFNRVGIHAWSEYRKGKKNITNFEQSVPRVFYLMTPTYGNLGDQAIEYATECYLKNNYSEFEVVTIHLQDIYFMMPSIQANIQTNDIIVLQGGGNVGNLYMECERARRYILKHLKNNCIILFPSTISFTGDRKGKRQLRKSKEVFNLNKNLTIISRERISFEFAKQNFYNCRNLLYPDIALYLHRRDENVKRNSIVICLRQDKESTLGDKRDKIINVIMKGFENIIITDTQLYKTVSDDNRISELESMFQIFLSAKCVITDRLHGMIFSVITDTPCLVFPSLDHKILGTYEWVKDNGAVRIYNGDDLNEIIRIIKQLLETKPVNINYEEKYFSKMKNDIKEAFE